MAQKNKLTTLSYFVKRLRDSGYVVDKLFTGYPDADSRAWSIIIDPGVASIFCTCYVNDAMLGETFFELHDGGHYIPGRHFKLKTDSIEVLVTYLNNWGVINKADTYPHAAKITMGHISDDQETDCKMH